jgi:YHS domain-containing protein
MEGLLSLLFYAGLFYVMMRFACGAHMMHGTKTGHNSVAVKRIDPVCDMEVDMEQGYGIMHEKQLYRFCSRNCLYKFEADPGRYIHVSTPASGSET